MNGTCGASSPDTVPTTTGGGHIEPCDSFHPAPIIPSRISTVRGSDAKPVLGGLINEYERVA